MARARAKRICIPKKEHSVVSARRGKLALILSGVDGFFLGACQDPAELQSGTLPVIEVPGPQPEQHVNSATGRHSTRITQLGKTWSEWCKRLGGARTTNTAAMRPHMEITLADCPDEGNPTSTEFCVYSIHTLVV